FAGGEAPVDERHQIERARLELVENERLLEAPPERNRLLDRPERDLQERTLHVGGPERSCGLVAWRCLHLLTRGAGRPAATLARSAGPGGRYHERPRYERANLSAVTTVHFCCRFCSRGAEHG